MELGTWYVILGVALIIIAFGERFIIYKFLVGQGQVLPDKAGMIANIICGATVATGVVCVLVNIFVRH